MKKMWMQRTRRAFIVSLTLMLPLSGLVSGFAWPQDVGEAGRQDGQEEPFLALLDLTRQGQRAPALAFVDGAGREVTLQSYAGESLVVNFWASWCAPCIVEMPALNALSQAFSGQGLRVLAINTDFDASVGAQWLQAAGLEALEPFYDATGNAFFDAGGTGLPYSLIIDPSGLIIAELFGDAPWDSPAARDYLSLNIYRP